MTNWLRKGNKSAVLLAVALFLALIWVLPRAYAPTGSDIPTETLAIETAFGRLEFTVEVPITPPQQQKGLMYREHLDTDKGMLFVRQREQEMAMWMKNTLIPLDMLFITADGRIGHIIHAVPQSLEHLSANQPVLAVLELASGVTAEKGIAVGDRVINRHFGQ